MHTPQCASWDASRRVTKLLTNGCFMHKKTVIAYVIASRSSDDIKELGESNAVLQEKKCMMRIDTCQLASHRREVDGFYDGEIISIESIQESSKVTFDFGSE